jgi:flagellar biogenesis protein FliO
MWGVRRTMPGQVPLLPKEVVDVLGRAALASRQQVYLLRCGCKLLLVSVTPAGVETLTEVVDPLEVDRLLGLCVQSRPGSTTAAFRQLFQEFAQEPASARSRPADRGHGDRPSREDRHG